jgi:thiol:disulfide interchange protein DsbA
MRFLQHVLAAGAVGLSLVAMSASAASAEPVAGKDYRVMGSAQPVDSGKKVEVTEFFSYMCPHCAAFDGPLTEWVKKQGDRIAFKRVPISFRESWVPQQKVYYTVEAMGKTEELHPKIFNAIHQQRLPFETDNAAGETMAKLGVDKVKFAELYSSFGIQSKVKRAAQLQDAYQIDSVPSIAIDGRFVTSPSMVGTNAPAMNEVALQAATLDVMDALVTKIYKEKNGGGAKPAAEPAKPAVKKAAKKAAADAK